MNNFKKITASPEALGRFLSNLPVLVGCPWVNEFCRVFCNNCNVENCDPDNCPHQAEQDNPTWWLKLEVEE